MTTDPKKPLVFPFTPDKAIRTAVHQIEDGEVQTPEDINSLILFMFEYPEREFYYFTRQGGPTAIPLKSAIDQNWILANTIENFYYRNPNHPSDFIHIPGGNLNALNMPDSINIDKPFSRYTLTLSEKCRGELQIQQTIQAHTEQNLNPLELKPNFMGLGIDLLKIPEWFKSLFKT